MKYRDKNRVQMQITKYSLEEANQLASDIRYGRPNDDLRSDITLGQFFAQERVRDEIKRSHKLGPRTAAAWLEQWKRRLCHESYGIAGIELKELGKKAPISAFLVAMTKDAVGEAAQSKVLTVLGAILDEAVEEGIIDLNPIRVMKGKPSGERKGNPYIPSVETIELLRREIMSHPNSKRRKHYAERDGLMISVLAYEAPRPEEFRGLNWNDVIWDKELLHIHAPKADRGKSTVPERYPPLNEVVAEDLRSWFETMDGPEGHAPILPLPEWGKREAGDAWAERNWNDWRNRVFKPALKRVAEKVAKNPAEHARIVKMRPYDLRHTAISLWLANGGRDEHNNLDGSPANPVEVAEWAGHDLRTTWETYAHKIKTAPKVPIADQIRAARKKLAS